MKNLFLLLFCMSFLVSLSFGQSQRLVLVEEFTSSTCGPCVNANSNLHNWLVANPTLFTSIYYHMSWPAPGNDPMYLANTIDNNARRSYYNVNSVPWTVVDGNVFSNNWNAGVLSIINNRSLVPSPFEISVQHSISTANDEIFLTMVAQATQNISGNLVAHNVVIEEYVQFTNPPGSNGEKNFDHVMKKMLPTKDGTTLSSFDAGDYVIIETNWPFAPTQVYDIDELMAVGFIQNNLSKEVYQAANSSTDALILPYDRDLQVLEIENVSSTNCSGVLSPIVTVRNNGNNSITAFDLNIEVNGGTVVTESWAGNIGPLEKAVIGLPEYTFVPQENNILKIFTDNPNNNADEYPKNDTLTTTIFEAPATTFTLILFLKTDNAPEETTWDVKDAQGNVVDNGGPYSVPNVVHRDTIELSTEGCYTFTIYDAGGQGICCSNGNGLYLLQDSQGTEVVQGGPFGSFEKTEFNASIVSARERFDQTRALLVYPNPASNIATASFYLVIPDLVSLNLYNAFGQKVWNHEPGYLGTGEHQIEMDAERLAPGVYILKLTTGSQVYTRKITISR